MAYTVDQYVKAIKAAEAAGNTEDARKLTQIMAESMGVQAAIASSRGAAATALQGLTLGLADEAAGIVGGPEAAQSMRSNIAAFRRESPAAAIGMEMAGGLPLGLGIGAGLGRMAQAGGKLGQVGKTLAAPAMLPQAGLGAVEGAVYGAGTGEMPSQRIAGAGLGAVLGGAGGAAAAPIAGALTRRFRPGMDAEKLLQSSIRQDIGRTPTATDYAELAYRSGQQPQRTLAELAGPTTEDLARTSAKIPTGGARTLAEDVLETRTGGTTGRLTAALQQGTGTEETFQQAWDRLEAQANAEAPELYRAAYQGDFTPDEELVNLTIGPKRRRLLRSGYERARETKEIREGAFLPAWEDVAGEGLEELDLQTWDHIKRGLDEQYKAIVRKDPARASNILSLKKQIVAKLDELGPEEYQLARAAWAAPKQQEEALEAGRQIFKEDAEYTNELLKTLSQGERDSYIIGGAQAIRNRLKNVPPEGGMPRFTELAIERMQAAFPSKQAFQNFWDALTSERDMQRFRNMVRFGSPTFEIQSSAENMQKTLGVAGAIGQALRGNLGDAARTGIGAMAPPQRATLTPEINEALSGMVFSRGTGIPPVLKRLQKPAIMPGLLPPMLTTQGAVLTGQMQPRQQPAVVNELEELRRRLPPGYEIVGE